MDSRMDLEAAAHPSPRCAKCDAAAWSIRDGKTVCHYCQTPFPASSPSQDSQEVRGKVADMIWAWTSAALNSQQSLDLADRILALLPQSPKGAAGADLDRLLQYLAEEVDYEDNAHLNAAILAREAWEKFKGGEPSAPKTGLRGAGAPGEGATCAWSYADPETGEWVTDCGTSWCFTDGDPIENEVKFCVGCGKPVEVLPEEPAPGDVGSAGGR